MSKVYIWITDHCIKKIQERAKIWKVAQKTRTPRKALFFWLWVFKEMIVSWEYKWNKCKYKRERNWKYSITDWFHTFIYAKRWKIEYELVTYYNVNWQLESKDIKMYCKYISEKIILHCIRSWYNKRE